MIALGDALAFMLLEQRQFTAEDFARFHPAGSLGRKLATVAECMRRGRSSASRPTPTRVREVFAQVRHPARRTGAIMLVDADGRLAGLFTDSDLARLFEIRRDNLLDGPIEPVMTKHPVVIGPEARVGDAIDLLEEPQSSANCRWWIADGRPVGMLDITDLIGLEPDAGFSNRGRPASGRPQNRVE